MADYDIFREQLAIKYPAYGHALWEPSSWKPDSPNKSVEVGDVGFIRNGRFHCLFNALRSAEEQSNVPEYHEKLVLKVSDHISRGSLSSNHYCSAGIDVEPEPEFHASSPDDFRQVSFKYPRKRGGAVLSLPVKARREDTLVGGYFGAWIVKHIDRWFAFARELGLIEQMEEIILVTGCDHTRSWTNVAFFGNEHNARATFGVKVEAVLVDHGSAIRIEWQSSPEHVQGAVLHRGPDGTNLPEDQCVFIRGFRVARTFRILPKHLKAAGSPSPDSDGYDSEPDVEAVSIAATPKYRDPLHILLDYIAERAPDCDMFLIHDDDLKSIDGLGDGTSLEALQPDIVMDLLRKSNIQIHSNLSHISRDPNSNIEVVRVAMYSNPIPHFSTPPAAPVPVGSPSSVPTTGQHRAQPSRISTAVARHPSPDTTTSSDPVTAPHLHPPVPIATASPLQLNSPLGSHPHQSQLSPPPLHPHWQSRASPLVNDTSKPLDRRLFSQQDQPHSPKRDDLDRGPKYSISKSPSETEELRPSSVISNQTRASASSASSHSTRRGRHNPPFRRPQNLTSRRRSKNPPFRPAQTRQNWGRHVVQGMRKDFTRVRPPPQYSVDEAPKAAGSSHPPYSPVEPHPPAKAQTSQIDDTTAPQASKAHATASAALWPGIVSNPSSEYATTDTEEDYDSWASEGISDVDAAGTSTGKRPSTKEIRRREPALEAQRLREPFPYLNPGRAQTGKTDGALQAPNARATASAASRRGIVSYSSSEYETSDTEDDDDWASDGVSVDAAGTSTSKRPPTKEARLRGAALEARRWRELFVKQPKPLSEHPVASDHDVTSTGLPSALTPSKSPAAPPLAAHVSAQAPIKTTITPSIPGGYRPKGHLQGDELEDESDDPDEVIQDSHSLAQQRLAAPAAGPFRRRASDNQVPTTTQTSPTMVAMEPMSFSHASDLPVPAPPATPRTTRRQMLATEFSESLRRNLLWERQVSKTKLANTGRRNELGGGGGGGGSRLVTTVVDESGNAQAVPPPPQQQQQHAQGSGDEAQESIVESGQRVLTRNRGWADDFHHAGW